MHPVFGKICLAIIILLFFTGTPFLRVHAGRTFTNEDLEKYENGPQASDPSEAPGAKDEEYTSQGTERPLRRYVIPYSGGARRIIVPVTFNGRVTANMLLDTGAPGMHISKRLAEELGLLDNKESNLWVMIGGIGGNVPAIFTIMDSIRVGDAESTFVPTFISPSISDQFEGLVGMDFMANYEVRLDTRQRVVIFEELPESADMPAGHDERWWRTTFSQFRSLRSVWEKYRDSVRRQESYTDRERGIQDFVERQYRKAEELYTRLSAYASQHSVPLEWR